MMMFTEEEEFILPDVDSQDLDTGQADIKTEIDDDVKLDTAPDSVVDSCDEKLALVQIKKEPSDVDTSGLTFEPGIENMESEMEFENRGTTCPEDFLHVQFLTTNQQGMRKENPTLQTESELVNFDRKDTSATYGFWKSPTTELIESNVIQNSDMKLPLYCEVPNSHTYVVFPTLFYMCLHCIQVFKCLEDLRKHHLIHEKVHIRNKCYQCSETFADIRMLMAHMKMHSTDVSEYQDKRLFIRNTIRSSHTIGTQLKCNQCDKVFCRAHSFEKHVLSHTPEKSHKCHHCHQTFRLESQLIVHTFSHTGENPLKCIQCGKVFFSKGQLNKHLIWHFELKPHKCSLCGKAFKEKGSLKIHLLVHTGKKAQV